MILDTSSPVAGELLVKVAGVTANGKAGVTWIHQVKFTGTRVPAQVPAIGTPVMIDCVATQEVFTVRGQKASRVRLLGKTLAVITQPVQTVTHGKVTFLQNAVNSFEFQAHLVRDALVKHTRAGDVAEARLAVSDRTGKLHFFQSEAWREAGTQLGRMRSGGEAVFACVLRRNKVGEKAFDVMEVLSVTPAPRSSGRPVVAAQGVRELAQAAD
ncbi:hypothetical protein [Deinococcus wulumuqiensis]|uniref:hypothetical protein n=1 Tax=Deinococcus wulumuqiensis TaxID=980427 RepID=UPI001966E960|nr:hypothetical protein [Deinococcus wulumuqiensis]